MFDRIVEWELNKILIHKVRACFSLLRLIHPNNLYRSQMKKSIDLVFLPMSLEKNRLNSVELFERKIRSHPLLLWRKWRKIRIFIHQCGFNNRVTCKMIWRVLPLFGSSEDKLGWLKMRSDWNCRQLWSRNMKATKWLKRCIPKSLIRHGFPPISGTWHLPPLREKIVVHEHFLEVSYHKDAHSGFFLQKSMKT